MLRIDFTQTAYSPLAPAHEGAIYPHDAWAAWNWDILLVLGLALGVLVYSAGLGCAWRQAGTGRGIRVWQALNFGGGFLALALALISPLDTVSAVLFSAHMAQHILLILVAAPLLALGAPHLAILWAIPRPWRHRLGGWLNCRAWRLTHQSLRQPLAVWALFVGILWTWHLPHLYQVALADDAVHVLEHVSLVMGAVLFWWMIAGLRRGRKLGQGLAIIYLFAAALQGGVLGALIVFSSTPWYEWYTPRASWWGLAPLEDQQIAGLIMWVPGGFIYLVAVLALLADWLRSGEEKARRRELINVASDRA